jgi:hypothetical protein
MIDSRDEREAIEAAPPLTGLLDPASLQPAAHLQPIKQRVERGDMELQLSGGSLLDGPADLVAVSRTRLDDRQD